MTTSPAPLRLRHLVGLVLVFAAGLLGIIGSGGGGNGFDPCANNGCNFSVVAVTVSPERRSVQIGTAVSLSSSVIGISAPTYQWERSSDGTNFTAIPGATEAVYRFTAQLPDDSTTFRVRVQGSNGVGSIATAYLAVSSLPGLPYDDTEFVAADWTSTTSDASGALHDEHQVPDGGNLGPYRYNNILVAAGGRALILNVLSTSSYDPPALGAVRSIDFQEDCEAISDAPVVVTSTLLMEQGGKFYALKNPFQCGLLRWSTSGRTAASVNDFQLVGGGACSANEACPDFSTSGAVIRFGYTLAAEALAGTAAGSVTRGIDNWHVTVWRR